ncbi:hypothetical protein ATV_gp01 [Bicaudavirus pozzuoliense]|uniref:Uncharacterized protein ORF54 n=1 Tax=Acidianus two-tailed virus TaxID=315953 RepID=Y054_ATV|nr:hypothetical protein ATV_gp01 [Acidianus two-tailed virus]Q3V4X0.1 RecName: Full=Uncharacterized protein ORF54 [Acidianus two-tailed virus]CAI59844.1 hypothetical protein [Acidianus two-tailed virus]
MQLPATGTEHERTEKDTIIISNLRKIVEKRYAENNREKQKSGKLRELRRGFKTF